MWILVVGREEALHRPDGAVASLRELGCRVETADLWQPFDEEQLAENPPTVLFIEAIDNIEAGRAALVRLRSSAPLAEVPVMVGVTVSAVQRLDPSFHRLGPNYGFDDFVLMPYVPAELYMRIRRIEWKRSDFAAQEHIKIGPLYIDLAAHEATVDGRVVDLTGQEFKLLSFLCQNRGRVFSREQLLQRVWGVNYYGGSRTVDIHVRRLRMKLGHAISSLQTVRGSGYKMKAP